MFSMTEIAQIEGAQSDQYQMVEAVGIECVAYLVAALYLIAYCVGNIIGPQIFDPKDYVPAEITIVVCWGVCLIFLAMIWWYCRRQNAIKAAKRAEPGYTKLENQVQRPLQCTLFEDDVLT